MFFVVFCRLENQGSDLQNQGSDLQNQGSKKIFWRKKDHDLLSTLISPVRTLIFFYNIYRNFRA